ncbi:MAG: oligopeptide/dipeptide ABC transporter ATP-binding protein, partial [Verrucomicrobiota bacterium]
LGVLASICDRIMVMYAGKILEKGDISDIFYRPRHPYTWSLLKSIPATHEKGEELFTIPGMPPDLTLDIKGCPFAPRCEHAKPSCTQGGMELKEIEANHETACELVQSGEIDVGSSAGTAKR